MYYTIFNELFFLYRFSLDHKDYNEPFKNKVRVVLILKKQKKNFKKAFGSAFMKNFHQTRNFIFDELTRVCTHLPF